MSARLTRFVSTAVKKGRGAARRAATWIERRRTPHPHIGKAAVFVVGSNRSGTQMVCNAIGQSPHGWSYRERRRSVAFKDYYLRRDGIIRVLIRLAPVPIVSFGSILDSQQTPELLGRFTGARAIWVYRRYQDAANSSLRKWGPHQGELTGWVARGELHKLGARAHNLSHDTVQLFRELYRNGISEKDGCCLYWYMRNRLYLDLDLDKDPRVLLVQYEDAVLHPNRTFRRVVNFLGVPFDEVMTEGIFSSSVGKDTWIEADPRIAGVCEELQGELDTSYHAQIQSSSGSDTSASDEQTYDG